MQSTSGPSDTHFSEAGDGSGSPVPSDLQMWCGDGATFDQDSLDRSLPMSNGPGISFMMELEGGKCNDMVLDGAGNIYLTGKTDDQDFPTTSGAFQTDRAGDHDVFVSKIDPTGSRLLYSTFIGGDEYDVGRGIAVDGSGCAYVTGYTKSQDFPSTNGSFDPTFDGSYDVFVLKLSADGSSLVYSSFLGQGRVTYWETGEAIQVDAMGCAYVTGHTPDRLFPTTPGAYNGTFNKSNDAFLTKFSPDGSTLEYSTRLGTLRSDYGTDLQLAGDGTVYLTGYTSGDNGIYNPATPGAYDESHNGEDDVFVLRFNITSSTLEYFTYIGGSGYDRANGLDIDSRGRVYITGSTTSEDFPSSEGSGGRASLDLQAYEVFVLRMEPDGSDLGYATVIGGSAYDTALDVECDEEGYAYVSGFTQSRDFPVTEGALDVTHAERIDDFMFKLSTDGSTLEYSTLFGRSGWDDGAQLALAPDGRVYMAGMHCTVVSFYPVPDTTPPLVTEDLTPYEGTTGDYFSFEANVSDDIGLRWVMFEYWDEGDFTHTILQYPVRTLGVTELNARRGFYLEEDADWSFTYIIKVMDQGGLWTTTEERMVTVKDNDAPRVEDETTGPATTGDPFLVKATVRDNRRLGTLNLTYWFGGGDPVTVSEEVGTIYIPEEESVSFEVPIPSDSTEALHYQFVAVDAKYNKRTYKAVTVMVIDDDLPVILALTDTGDPTTGDGFPVLLAVEDNIGVFRVELEYWWEDLAHTVLNMTPSAILDKGDGAYTHTVQIPEDLRSPLNYRFTAYDFSGNTNQTSIITLGVRDDDLPSIVPAFMGEFAVRGLDFTFVAKAWDNIGVNRAYVNYSFEDEGFQTEVLMSGEPLTAQVIVPRHVMGSIKFRMIAIDEAGNVNSTLEYGIPTRNLPPDLSGLPSHWYVDERHETWLDLMPYLMDPNDPVSDLELSVISDHVRVEGTNLVAYFPYCMGNVTITLHASDGEITSFGEIVVVVQDVNSPPDVPQIISPHHTGTIRVGEEVSMVALIGDPDMPEGQVLEVRWFSHQLGQLAQYTTNDTRTEFSTTLPPGVHVLTIKVFDGEFETESSIVLTVEGEPSDEPFDWTLVVIILVVAAVPTVVMIHLRMRKGGRNAGQG